MEESSYAAVVMIIEDLYLTAKPISAYRYDEKRASEAKKELKRQAIANYENWKEAKKRVSRENEEKQSSFSEKLVSKIAENVQITLRTFICATMTICLVRGHALAWV